MISAPSPPPEPSEVIRTHAVCAAARALTSRRDRLPPALDRTLDRVRWARAPWTADPATAPTVRTPDGVPARVLIGPANFAGQGDRWARALRAHGVPAVAWQLSANPVFAFAADHHLPLGEAHRASRRWQRAAFGDVVATVEAVVHEAGRPLFGRLHGFDPAREAAALAAAGVRTGVLWHGTDVRSTAEHARRHPASPYRLPELRERAAALEAVARRNRRRARSVDGPVLVSTPDLLDEVPGARWCPVVVDVEGWASTEPVLERDVPVVVHVPSSPALKGTDLVTPVLARLEREGLVRAVVADGVPSSRVRELYRSADVVLDQFRLGIYGAAACEAMAAGRVVVSHVHEEVRGRVTEETGRELPVLEATGADLEEVLRGLLADRAGARRRADEGPEFVRAVHDGTRSAAVLRSALGV